MKLYEIFTIIIVAIFAQFSTDIFLPSIATMASQFEVRIEIMQLLISIYLTTLTLTQLIWGPISDIWGRNRVLIFSFAITAVGSLICMTTNIIEIFLLGRFIQGIGTGVAACLFRAILRDSYDGTQLAKIASYLSNLLILTLMIAPILGGFFETHASWRFSFGTLFIMALISIFLVSKSLANEKVKKYSKLSYDKVIWLKAYNILLKSRVFMGCCVANLLTYGGMYALVTSSSVILIDQMGMDPAEFGFWSAAIGFAIMIGAFVNANLVGRLGLSSKNAAIGLGSD